MSFNKVSLTEKFYRNFAEKKRVLTRFLKRKDIEHLPAENRENKHSIIRVKKKSV